MDIAQFVTGPFSVNTWCVPLDSDHSMVVDPGGDADIIIAHLSALHSTVSVILLTHGHFDHLTALAALARRYPNAKIAIHQDDERDLGKGAINRHYEFFTRLGAGSLVKKYGEELPEPTLLLEEGTNIFGWKVLHTPGHSPGSVCLYNEAEKTLISGDTLFNSGVGRTDGPGGSQEKLEKSLQRLFHLPSETVVLPGHGLKTTIEAECR